MASPRRRIETDVSDMLIPKDGYHAVYCSLLANLMQVMKYGPPTPLADFNLHPSRSGSRPLEAALLIVYLLGCS